MPRDALVPPLVLQPLIENAVYHGIEPRVEPGIISIHIYGTRRPGARRAAQSVPSGTATATPATGWRSPTSASACSCISTPRRASRRSERDGIYEVHIVMPYLKGSTTSDGA